MSIWAVDKKNRILTLQADTKEEVPPSGEATAELMGLNHGDIPPGSWIIASRVTADGEPEIVAAILNSHDGWDWVVGASSSPVEDGGVEDGGGIQ